VTLLRARPFGRSAAPGAFGASRPQAASLQPFCRSAPAGAHADRGGERGLRTSLPREDRLSAGQGRAQAQG